MVDTTLITENKTIVGIVGALLLIAGIGILGTSAYNLSIPGSGAIAGDDVSITADRTDTALPLKTVSPGTSEVKYEVTIENTADFSARYKLLTLALADDQNSGGASIEVRDSSGMTDNSGTTTPGDPVEVFSEPVALDPGETETFVVSVAPGSEADDGDNFSLAMTVKDSAGNDASATINKEVDIATASASIAVQLAGTVMSVTGMAMLASLVIL